MGKHSDSVRFLDDFDLTLSLDSRSTSSQLMTNIEINAKPIVFRASYRDIMLISSIVNKALELSGSKTPPAEPKLQSRPSRISASKKSSSKMTTTKSQKSVGKARVVTSKEQASCLTLGSFILTPSNS